MRRITLVRVDGDAKHEVDIPVGETIIGRGPVMQCTDKRVSRTHAQIKVSEEGKIELTSTSQNPCYCSDGKVISKSTSVELNIGDQFSFLPGSYCYCIKSHEAEESESFEEKASSSDNFRINNTSEQLISSELTANIDGIRKEANVYSISNLPESDGCDGKIVVPLTDADIATDTSSDDIGVCVSSTSKDNGPTDTSLDSVKKYVPRWLLAATERVKSGEGEHSVENVDTKKTEEDDSVKKVAAPKRKINVEDGAEIPPAASAHDLKKMEEDDSTKKVEIPKRKKYVDDGAEIAPPARAHELSDVSDTEEPTNENHSHTQQSVNTEHTGAGTVERTEGSSEKPGNSQSPSKVTRDACRYGTACYRKNPHHRAEYSHPGDSDYEEDNRPECPYGTECYRRNPLHKQSYKHTNNPSKKPPKKRQKTKKTETDENSEDDDDYDYDDPFLNDGSSDDYEPTDSDSEVSASEGEEEDTKRTKKEAKRFIQGKRKH